MNQFHKQKRTIEFYWNLSEWLGNRMLFLSGPRQVGKTTLVTTTLCKQKEAYFNWDNRKVRSLFRDDADFFSYIKSKWICFDEIHKRPKWKDILKGIYDSYKNRFQFIITGSARLDTFKRSGDSLVGRYFHTHLFPLNLPDFVKNDFVLPESSLELIQMAADTSDAKGLEELLALSGFPEPFYSGKEIFWKRWSNQHQDLILTEDLRDLTRVIEIDKISVLVDLLKPAVGQTTSNLNLANDLETTHGSIKRWLEILNKVQLIFPVSPYSKKIRRAYKQEKKWYFMDWKVAQTNIFENFVASSLMRAVILYNDRFGEQMTLHFIRTHDGTEIDFLICKNNIPWLLIEAKQGTPNLSHAVYRFSSELRVPCIIVTKKPGIYKKISDNKNQIFYLSWSKLGPNLP